MIKPHLHRSTTILPRTLVKFSTGSTARPQKGHVLTKCPIENDNRIWNTRELKTPQCKKKRCKPLQASCSHHLIKKLNPSYAGSPQTQIRSTRQANPCPPEEARKREGKKGGRDSIEETKPHNDKNINEITASFVRQLLRRRLQRPYPSSFRPPASSKKWGSR